LPEGIEVDVLFGRQPWLREALRNPNYDKAGYPVIRLPYLVLMKLTTQRVQDWADVSRMLGWASAAELEAVRAVIARYSPDDVEDLEALIYLGQQEQAVPADTADVEPSAPDDAARANKFLDFLPCGKNRRPIQPDTACRCQFGHSRQVFSFESASNRSRAT
jgi:hypothetical protein